MIKSIRVLYIKRIQIFRMEHINSQFGQRQMGNRMFYNFMRKNYGGSELDTTIETSDINWNILV